MGLQEFIERFNQGLALLVAFDRKTLEDQGHRFTGKLINSIHYEIEINGNRIQAEFIAEDYGIDLDEGLPPSLIGSLDEYQRDTQFREWVKVVLGKSDEEVDSTIFYIWRKWKQEGFPTQNSRRFSKTGERINWIKIGTENFETNTNLFFNIEDSLDDLFEQALSIIPETA